MLGRRNQPMININTPAVCRGSSRKNKKQSQQKPGKFSFHFASNLPIAGGQSNQSGRKNNFALSVFRPLRLYPRLNTLIKKHYRIPNSLFLGLNLGVEAANTLS